jgi:transcriptional regulator with XRE-family HTH domain
MTIPWDGNRLKAVIEENQQSYCDVAHTLGVWPYTVMRWASGASTPRLRYRRKLEAIYPALTIP